MMKMDNQIFNDQIDRYIYLRVCFIVRNILLF